MSWSAESYQLVAFHPQYEIEDAFQMWLSLFQQAPDNYQRHPDVNARATRAHGSGFGFEWQLQCSPGRVELFLTGESSSHQIDSPFPLIHNDQEGLNLIKTNIIKALASKIKIIRLGFVCSFFHDYATMAEVHEKFTEVTGIKLITEKSLDAKFGINVRTNMSEFGLILNRLCNWLALEKQAMQIAFNAHTQQTMGMITQQFAPNIIQPSLVFNLDINTTVNDSGFDPVVVEKIFAFMLAEASKLKEGGYNELIST